MSNATTSVIIASGSAVAKVFVIGAIGYVSAKRPRPVPILPPHAMDGISKMNFNLLILPLIYYTLASAVTPEKLGSLWFLAVSAVGVICLSYGVATLLEKLPFFRVENRTDFDALRVASAFPNIVALPILIFPTLCEFPVVYDAFYEGQDGSADAEKIRYCVDQSNAMIFVYFFGYNLVFWILGYPALVAAGQKRQMNNTGSLSTTELSVPVDSFKNEDSEIIINVNAEIEREEQSSGNNIPTEGDDEEFEENQSAGERSQIQSTADDATARIRKILQLFANALLQTIKSPGFIAMIAGFITACIPPLRYALFSSGGALRFFGSAMESLGKASASVGTLVVAASLVHQSTDDSAFTENAHDSIATPQAAPHANYENGTAELELSSENNTRKRVGGEESTSDTALTQQHSKDLRSSMRRRRSSISRMSSTAIAEIRRRKPTIRMHAWFIFSRLIAAPAIVCLLIMAMDCGGVLDGIPNVALAKMVVIVNAGLPGAQLIVLTLKSKELSDSASIVAQVYLPSYLLSVVTIAAWSSLGLMISVSHEDGTSICTR
mmetsp:Transcript_3646/g.9266  ORF Transcript_3646/g.9266 Transcript_3646/m.9266 type:complete len:551 (+) Transcript_3646:171-1823(+)|eukprot:CAMPEP_0181082592 /NCGR_PEP_ID=MMETSP1071-20121207/3705_1 /TAXON_ID=35127 /ORGANISM="Thalassiosira sp., Strain NH16" /LENGTH=550 /DNA_ID=CAMNT_0023164191 /DNA_START=110 /DNA_END=1762 /DNA_ORIENTATION=+